jgi:hypothetical protein
MGVMSESDRAAGQGGGKCIGNKGRPGCPIQSHRYDYRMGFDSQKSGLTTELLEGANHPLNLFREFRLVR